MDSNKDKLIELWKLTCAKRSERLDKNAFNSGLIDAGNINIEDKISPLGHNFHVRTQSGVAFSYEKEPNLALVSATIAVQGNFTIHSKKEKIEKKILGIIYGYDENTRIFRDEKEVEKIEESYNNPQFFENSYFYYEEVYKLIFGNCQVYISKKEADELKEEYLKAAKRIDVDILEKRINEYK